ncbi:lipopolysaccharide/colanic/teichoic acid biosynthesis glycosyltransferase [Streptomyces sp. SAI-144]|uniref:sugar transferase n=1 Tax=Streptomyces sp. SAI-144 TaxID=2940544 RepID=UPI0024730076|nr:sugar transferase [Streptomyces sp. SAI-144]MDH6438773.1 lipopolysaccharide/colanic/teichoic acid biosynthesis glycosyltransferase [Streptomyces sp. SAI-144]
MSTRDDDNIAATIHDLLTSIGARTPGSGLEGSGAGQRIQDFRDALDAQIEAEISDTEVERKLLEIKVEAARRAVLRNHRSGSTALQEFLNLSAVTDREGGKPERRASRTPPARARRRHWWFGLATGLLITLLSLALTPLGQGHLPQWCDTLLPSVALGMSGPAVLLAVIHIRGLRERRSEDLQPEALMASRSEPLTETDSPAPMRRGRRALDVIVSVSLLWMSILILVAATAGIRMTSAGPVLVRRPRVGAGGRLFHLYDFRTQDSAGNKTRVGKLLQETGLEALPRLWNLLRGDVTLLGPPAEHPAVAEAYPEKYRWVFACRPGIVGPLWNEPLGLGEGLPEGSDALRYYLEIVVPHRVTANRDFYDGLSGMTTGRLMARMLFSSNSFTTCAPADNGNTATSNARPFIKKPYPLQGHRLAHPHPLCLTVWQ